MTTLATIMWMDHMLFGQYLAMVLLNFKLPGSKAQDVNPSILQRRWTTMLVVLTLTLVGDHRALELFVCRLKKICT